MVFDAIIVGCGPAGSTIGLLLARAGWKVALIEKKKFPRRKVCGEFISATTFPLFSHIGIADFINLNSGPQIHHVGLFAGKKILTSPMPNREQSFSKWGRAIGRDQLDTVLIKVAEASGATLFQPWDAVELLRDKNKLFFCRIQQKNQEELLRAPIIIMANGSWGKNILTETKKHLPSDLLAFKAYFKNSNLTPGLMPAIIFPGGYGGLVHTSKEKVSLSCCIRRDILQHIRQSSRLPAGEAVLQHILSSCRGVQQVLLNAYREGTWLATGPLQPGIRKLFHRGIFFVGNSAGEAHPIIAEGISMAMQSAWLLSKSLEIQHKDPENNESILHTGLHYSKRWRELFASRLYVAALFAKLAMHPNAVSLLLPIIEKFPQMITTGAKLSGKIYQVVPGNSD